MKTTLTVELEYDPAVTDPESLASAMDRLLETVLSTPGILDEYNNPRVGEFLVAKETAARFGPRVVLNIHGGVLQDVFSSDPTITLARVDWDTEGCDPSEDGVIEVPDGHGGMQLAAVAQYPLLTLTDLADTETEAALKAAGLDWCTQPDRMTEVVRRWVIYDPDADALLTTRAYGSYDEACEDAARANDVLVLPLTYENVHT